MTKSKICPICKEPFIKRNSLQKVCFKIECCLAQGKLDKERNLPRIESARRLAERKALSESRDRIKSRQDWLKDVQQVFNSYIRERDKDQRCISCGRGNEVKYNAGHYRTVKAAPELRFDEDNCHLQCEHCNSFLSGNISNYRPRLLAKIGPDRLARIEGNNPPKQYSIDDLKAIKAEYKQKLKELKSSRANCS